MINTNYIVKIENGKPVIFGVAGSERDGTAPTYIFETKEAFDAALEAGMIPIGALIIKTYDAIEMAGGPFDDALSDKSENAVQNKVLTKELEKKANGSGITFSIEEGILYASFNDGT